MKQLMDYSFLRGKIIEKSKSISVFAKQLGISNQELSNKLNNKSSFTQEQIGKTIDILGLNENETCKCFFCTLKVEKNSTL